MPRGFHLGKGTVIRFQGADRCKVFNNLCTQDLRKLADGQALETFVTDVKGRTFGHGIAMSIGQEAFLVSVPEQASKLVPHFDRYIIREDAIVTDVSDAYEYWLFQDRSSAAQAFSIDDSIVPHEGSAISFKLDGQQAVLMHAPWIGPESILALVPTGQNDEGIVERLGNEWIKSDMTHRTAWELDRIQAFWPWYGIDMDDRHLPQELARDGQAISFNKGCYLGQETIARLDMLGKVQKKLVTVRIDSNLCPKPPMVLQSEGKEIGTVCSVALDSAAGHCLALAYVKRSHFASGTVLSLGETTATVFPRSPKQYGVLHDD